MSLTEHTLKVDKEVAREALRAYREAKAPATDEDRAIMTAYREIARGRMVIQAIQSIRTAGWNADGTTKLALIRADLRRCFAGFSSNAVVFSAPRAANWRGRIQVAAMPQRPDSRVTRCARSRSCARPWPASTPRT